MENLTLFVNFTTTSPHHMTSSKEIQKDSSLHLKFVDYVLLIPYCLVVVIGVGGNLLVIKWFCSPAKKGRPGSLLVNVLAVNDLIASIVTPFLEIHQTIAALVEPYYAWYLGKGLCKCLFAFHNAFLLNTSWLLVAIAAERYR